MPVVKRIVCLANSRKYQGRCIAGKERLPDGSFSWVRPVSARPNESLNEAERRYEDDSEPKLLDVIDVPLLQAAPHFYQKENWLLEPRSLWSLHRRAEWRHLAALADDPPMLWTNESSSFGALNDRVPAAAAAEMLGSLYLLRLEDVALHLSSHDARGNPHWRLQASFTYRDAAYKLSVTDPEIEMACLTRKDGVYRLGRAYATISLGKQFRDGFCYKLVAALILPTTDAQ